MPHNGSRTLVEHLRLYAHKNGLGGNGIWWHFKDDRLCRHVFLEPHFAHIPIRHPLDVARSWACRNKTGDVAAAMVGHYTTMFRYLEEFTDYELHKIEDLPRLKGMNEHAPGDHTARINRLQDVMREQVISPHRAFFEQFYDDLDRIE